MKITSYLLFLILFIQPHLAKANDGVIASDYLGLELSWGNNSTLKPELNLTYTDTAGQDLRVPIYSNTMYQSNMSCVGDVEKCNRFFLGTMTLFIGLTYLMYELDVYE